MQTLSPQHCWPQIKHLGMGLMHKSRWSITQVYNGQLTLLTETLTQRESSKDTFFFHCAQRCAVWGSGISLMMQSDSKMTHPAMCLAHHESNSFSIWTYIFFSCPIYVWTVFNYIIYLYVSWLRHTAGLINQCHGQMYSSSGTYVQLFQDRCSGTIVQRPARSIRRSSRKQLS